MIAETRSYIFRWRSRFCHRVCLSSLFVATGVNCWCHLFLHNLEQSQKLTCFLWDGLLLLRSVSLVASMVVLLVVHGSHCFSSSYLSGDMMWRFQILRSEMVSLCCNEEIFLHQEFHGIIYLFFIFTIHATFYIRGNNYYKS